MRHPKTTMVMVASLVLTVFLGLAGCGDDHSVRYHDDRNRSPERYERQDSDRHEERQGDRHEERGGDSSHDRGEHGDR